jgi:sugar/nucleoside kinase (ribokinase family)
VARHLHWAAPPELQTILLLRTKAKTISLDAGYEKTAEIWRQVLRHVDLFFANEIEAERIT